LVEKVASLEADKTGLVEKLASMERNREIEIIAKDMEEKGLNAELTFEEKIASIRNHRDLENVKEAVKMASSGEIRIANVSDLPGPGSTDSLTSFCLGGE
jgi:SepF-like predicted cell division protein (DUF552 family)